MMKNKALAWSLLAFLTTLLLHGWIMARHVPAPNFQKYPLAARQYNNRELAKERLADFSPLYLHLHAAAQKWLPRPERALLWLQVLLTALAAGLLLRLLWLYFPPFLALSGAVIFMFDRGIMIYEHSFEPEIPLLFFLLAFFYCCCGGSSASRHFFAGTFLALALLCRLNFLPLMILAPWHFRLQNKKGSDWLKASALFLLPVFLALGGLSLRNRSVQGSFSPLAMNPGTVFYEGNNPNSLGQSSIYPPLVYDLGDEFSGQPDCQHLVYRLVARADSGKNLSISAVNRFWSGKAANFMRDHPINFLRLLGVKTNFFFHNFRRHDLASAFWDDQKLRQAKIPTMPFALVSALAILGLFLARADWRRFLLFYGLFFFQMAVLLLTYVSARQRVAVTPVFIFFACAAAQKIWDWKIRSRRILAAAAVMGLALLLTVENDAMKEESHQWRNFRLSQDLYRQAREQRQNGLWAEAGISSLRAMAAAPWLGDSLRPANLSFAPRGYFREALAIHETLADPDFSHLFDRGVLSLAAGELDKARSIFIWLGEQGYEFKRDYDQSSQPKFYLARIALGKNDRASALALLAAAGREAPGDPEILAFSFVLTGREEFKNRIDRYFDRLDRDFFIGKAFLEMGEPGRAVPYFTRLGRLLPFYRRGQIYLAAALAGSGQTEKGAEIYFAALAKRQDPVFLEKEVLSALRHWAETPPAKARSHFFYGLALRQFGHFRSALAEQQKALALAPDHQMIKREIQRLAGFMPGAPAG
jgi:tetratricopeptide (TPR) repeat protein